MVMVALGISARSIIPQGTGEDDVLLKLVKSVMPAEGYALLLVVLVSIVMSSLDSLLNAGAVAFTQDIVKPFAKVPDNTALVIGRSATIIIAAIAAVGAVAVPSIISGLLICYSIWAPAILPALIIGLWIKRPRPLAGILSMGIGTLVAVCFQFILPSLTTKVPAIITEVPAIIPALGAALLAYVVGHWIAKIREERK
jgi:SSS family solute:Na+ symporter